MAKIGVIGAGSWGTALSRLLANNGHDVIVWSIIEAEVKMLQEKHEHVDKLPGVKLPESMEFTTDLKKRSKERICLYWLSLLPLQEVRQSPCACLWQKDRSLSM